MESDELRRPLLLIGLVIAILIVLAEAGSAFITRAPGASALDAFASAPRPGYGIAYLAAIDLMLVYSLSLMSLSVFAPRELAGRIQGLVGFVVSLLGLLALLAMMFFALRLLILMVSLLLAPIFGTIAYFALFADFERDAAAGTLMIILMLKVALVICLVLAQQRFLQNKSLVVLVVLSLACTLLVSLLHAFPPSSLVSITDALAALIIAVVALIWAVFLLVGSLWAIVKAVA